MESSSSLAFSFAKEYSKRSSLPSYEPVHRSNDEPHEYQGYEYQYEEPEDHSEILHEREESHPEDYQYEEREYHPEDYQYEEREYHPEDYQLQKKPWTKRKAFWITIVISSVTIILVVVLPVLLIADKKHGVSDAAQSTSSNRPVTLTGGDGSTVTLANGSTFTYENKFGGFWVQDPADPFNNNAQPNSWTSPLNQSWKWGQDRIMGVNLGGWLTTEPFVTPDMYQKYPEAEDEYTLSIAMAADAASGGLDQLERHYDTFITEQDFAEIAGAGLNFVRLPMPYWAIETWPGEPYLGGKGWQYALKAMNWCRKYGLRMILDFHALPGSQNGYNHSGKITALSFLSGNMGYANAQRAMNYIRTIVEFISQKEYQNVVVGFGLVNEPLLPTIGMGSLLSFYLEAHDMIRNITGYGEGNGPYIFIHDSFNIESWTGALAGADRWGLDLHEYFAFAGPDTSPLDVPAADGLPGGKWPLQACNAWAPFVNQGREGFGITVAGEITASPTDCGLFTIGVNISSQNSNCAVNINWKNFDDTMKAGIQNFVKASVDALQDTFFWTWKIGPALNGSIEAPLWSYQLGLNNGWIPTDPRTSYGKCAALGSNQTFFSGPYQPWQTGASTTTIAASSKVNFPWPPPTISNAQVPFSLLPTYTNTGPIVTLQTATFTSAPSSVTASVDGWFNQNDQAPGITPVAGCLYPDEYTANFTITPTAPCIGTGVTVPATPAATQPVVPTSVVTT